MQNIKSCVFLYLTPRQKSQLLGTLKSYFKKFPNLNKTEIIDKFLEDEKYYLDIGNPHFEFVGNYLNDDDFYHDMEKYFNFLAYEKEQMALIEPYKQKQKEFAKEQRKRAQEFKMSKMKPTSKQLFYYEKISKAHDKPMKDTSNASRLDLRNWIMEILEEND